MRKIPTLFMRNLVDMSRVTREVNPVAAWVLAGEGRATRKFDGACVKLDEGGRWWSRREVKPGKPAPPGFAAEEMDPNTGKTVGWEPIEQSAFYRWFQTVGFKWEQVARSALALHFEGVQDLPTEAGTYELCGPRVHRNPEGFEDHVLVPHGAFELDDIPLDYDGLATYLKDSPYEGIVWHRGNGDMAKLKRRDFA